MRAVEPHPARKISVYHRGVAVAEIMAAKHPQRSAFYRTQIDPTFTPPKIELLSLAIGVDRRVVPLAVIDLVGNHPPDDFNCPGYRLLQLHPFVRPSELVAAETAAQKRRAKMGRCLHFKVIRDWPELRTCPTIERDQSHDRR